MKALTIRQPWASLVAIGAVVQVHDLAAQILFHSTMREPHSRFVLGLVPAQPLMACISKACAAVLPGSCNAPASRLKVSQLFANLVKSGGLFPDRPVGRKPAPNAPQSRVVPRFPACARLSQIP